MNLFYSVINVHLFKLFYPVINKKA